MNEPAILMTTESGPDCADMRDWLIAQGLEGASPAEVFHGFCQGLAKRGLPLKRAYMSIKALHPKYGAYGYLWQPGANRVDEQAYDHGAEASNGYLKSPFYYMVKTEKRQLRRRLVGQGAVIDFPILRDLRDQGMTDYAAAIMPFARLRNGEQTGFVLSCATDHPDGFSDDHMATLHALLPPLALVLKARTTYDVAASVLETYLGKDAGHRVLNGEIKRGSAETIRAVLWYCDLRDFTALADEIPREELLELLNDYLECLVEPVQAYGGQVLKFLGDGFLATFDINNSELGGVCATALNAAAEARAAADILTQLRAAAGKPTVDFGVALHVGEVLYGNIGASDRLDFTVIGAAVNEVSRIEALCRPLHTKLLVSKAFKDAACHCADRLVPLGEHQLRGVREPQELFTLAG